MNWIKRLIFKKSVQVQEEELKNFISILKGMDGEEMGMIVALATHMRHLLESEGHIPIDPINYTSINPGFPLFLSKTVNNMQKNNQLQEAGALMVWAHTARGAVCLQLRNMVREMWAELARGFPHVEKASVQYAMVSDQILNTSDSRRIPIGFTPEPLP